MISSVAMMLENSFDMAAELDLSVKIDLGANEALLQFP
jgi:hypothetical protein